MPELPEVEILVRHLAPRIRQRVIRSVEWFRTKVIEPTSLSDLQQTLTGSRFLNLTRRGKYLVFHLRPAGSRQTVQVLGHLGMTGRMHLLPAHAPLPQHTALVLHLDRGQFVYHDTRGFGRFTLDVRPLLQLGPEPLADEFTPDRIAPALQRSRQPVKVRLLDQSLIAGLGNIYASESLFHARISPRIPCNRLSKDQIHTLCRAIRFVLSRAIRFGGTLPLDWAGTNTQDRLFYFGRPQGAPASLREQLRVYDRHQLPCPRCRTPIERLIQAGRSSFFCPHCQPAPPIPQPRLLPGKPPRYNPRRS
jgi:formamidopyrimidine-DNA glycosylase